MSASAASATSAATATPQAPTFSAASLDRRFYAFTIDRLIAWGIDLAVALVVFRTLIAEGSTLAGVAVIIGTVLVVGAVFAVLQGLQGFTPGKLALGLRVVHLGTGTPIGVVASLLRTLMLGISALPTFGLGAATLAWTAVMDRDRQRRGWHDHQTESIVVDVRPVPVEEVQVEAGPRHIVNLTAMRLVPAPRPAPAAAPARKDRTGQGAVGAQPAAAPSVPPVPERALLDRPHPVPSGHATGESTVVRGAGYPAPARWSVAFDTGETFAVEGLALVGRRPEPRPGEPVRHLVPLTSGDMSLSKTHAQLQVAPDGVLVVLDRGSTNGTVLVRQGVARQLVPGQPTTLLGGDLVRFGDRQMTVACES